MARPTSNQVKDPVGLFGYDTSTNKWTALATDSVGSLGAGSTSGKISNKDDAGAGIIYYGWAAPGSATSSAVWMIIKMDKSADPDYTIRYADGDTNYDNSWDGRAGLSYS